MHPLPGYLAIVTLVQVGAPSNEHVPPPKSCRERWWFSICSQLESESEVAARGGGARMFRARVCYRSFSVLGSFPYHLGGGRPLDVTEAGQQAYVGGHGQLRPVLLLHFAAAQLVGRAKYTH